MATNDTTTTPRRRRAAATNTATPDTPPRRRRTTPTPAQVAERKAFEAKLVADTAAEAAARHRARVKRLRGDPDLDPRVVEWYLDTEVWDIHRQAEELGISRNRIHMLRANPDRGFPTHDAIIRFVAGVPNPGTYAGRIREYAVRKGRNLLNPKTGKLSRPLVTRYGASRSDSPTRIRKAAEKNLAKAS